MDDPAKTLKPKTSGKKSQFRITTLLSSTAVVAVLFGIVQGAFGGSPDFPIALISFGPLLFPIPVLIDHLLMREGALRFHTFWKVWLTLAVSIYSSLLLMLSTVAFDPSWKGDKGMHWLYYVLDFPAALTLWPIYFTGAFFFARGLWYPARTASRLYLLTIMGCVVICSWYVAACLFLNYTQRPEAVFMVFLPGSSGVCFGLYALLLFRTHKDRRGGCSQDVLAIRIWLAAFVTAIVAKIPLAMLIYDNLPDKPPDCFVVTAAGRGHARVVGVWWDRDTGRIVNRQLLTFWDLEQRLQNDYPSFHRRLRKVYNVVGPLAARCVVFRWQADCVYLALKPLEWFARHFTNRSQRNADR